MIFVQLNQDGLKSTGKRSILHCGREDFRDVFREDFREDFKSQLNRTTGVCIEERSGARSSSLLFFADSSAGNW